MSPVTTLEMQRQTNMRPTLLIGLGGTGQKVLVQLKARFIRNFGGVPDAVRFYASIPTRLRIKPRLKARLSV